MRLRASFCARDHSQPIHPHIGLWAWLLACCALAIIIPRVAFEFIKSLAQTDTERIPNCQACTRQKFRSTYFRTASNLWAAAGHIGYMRQLYCICRKGFHRWALVSHETTPLTLMQWQRCVAWMSAAGMSPPCPRSRFLRSGLIWGLMRWIGIVERK